MARLAALLLVCLAFGALSSEARAQSNDLQRAQDAYAAADYEQVRTLLYPMVGGLVPAIDDPFLIRDARRYLGAAYVLLDRVPDAENQFSWLLRGQELDDLRRAQLEPTIFLSSVRAVFDRLRDARIAELEAAASDRDQLATEREARRHDALLRLMALAQSVEGELEVDPLPTYVPFGIGQFANGNEGLGWFFAVSEGLTLLLASVSLAVFIPLDDQAANPGMGVEPVDSIVLETLGGLNWAASGAFAALAIAGVIEARVSFTPTRRRTIQQEIPRDVLEQLELTAGPGGVTLRGRFW